tara:strand:- start:7 stop:561 length:555 start_codon:yes stop_codon:yes gene_type:complete
MKGINLVKSLPILSTLFLIVFININNDKEYTKLRILIWTTPSLSLGSYIAISTGTGFLLSYVLTTKIINNYKNKFKIENDYASDNENYKANTISKKINTDLYDNILIERDINDPLPTIKASFRVIGNTNLRSDSTQDFYNEEHEESEVLEEFDSQYNEDQFNYRNHDKNDIIMDDWLDDTYLNW